MPNLARGYMDVSGTKESVTAFVMRIYMDGRPSSADMEQHFACTVSSDKYQKILYEIDDLFHGLQKHEERQFRIYVEFAWSAHVCLISGYPEDAPGKCITLPDACRLDQVDVSIHTEEPLMGFREKTHCDRNGELHEEVEDLSDTAICKQCGAAIEFDPFDTMEDLRCSHCGCTDFIIQE